MLSNQYHPNHTHVTSVLNNTMTLQVNINKQKKEKNAEHSTYPISAPPLKIGSATVHLGVQFSLLLAMDFPDVRCQTNFNTLEHSPSLNLQKIFFKLRGTLDRWLIWPSENKFDASTTWRVPKERGKFDLRFWHQRVWFIGWPFDKILFDLCSFSLLNFIGQVFIV